MKTYTTSDIIITLKQKNISLFTLSDFARLFDLKNYHTLYKKIQRLEEKKIIKKIVNGKYVFNLSNTDEFTIANFIIRPSYISLESALSFYGIITGFSYSLTSVTTKSTKKIILDEKEYTYSHISPSLMWGYEKKEQFLIAQKEKAILDYCYFSLKGLRNSLDFDEVDLSQINKHKLLDYAHQLGNAQLLKIIKKI